MKKPKMIIFDYGHTLCYEPDFNSTRGNEAIMKHIVRNRNNLSASEISEFEHAFFNGIAQNARDLDIELHNYNAQRFIYEYLQIDFDLPLEQIESIFWEHAAPSTNMPNIEKTLEYLKNNGIRSGVISNISFSYNSLSHRINTLLPNNEFEFIIASSEYVYRKPHRMIFELALRKAELSADEVWFCGDHTKCDVAGAMNAGIFPVWFHSHFECVYRDKSLDVRPDFDHLYIRDWQELIEVLEHDTTPRIP